MIIIDPELLCYIPVGRQLCERAISAQYDSHYGKLFATKPEKHHIVTMHINTTLVNIPLNLMIIANVLSANNILRLHGFLTKLLQ